MSVARTDSGGSTALGVLVLAGGSAQRLGGIEKTAITLAGRTVLDHSVAAWPAESTVVVVGPPRVVSRTVIWARESPPGGGPVSAIAAGLELLDTELVAIAAGDAPLIAPGVTALVHAARAKIADGGDGAVAVDPDGRQQHLPCCVLRSRLLAALPDHVSDAALWPVLTALDLVSVAMSKDVLHDVDTPDDLSRAKELLEGTVRNTGGPDD